MRSALPLASLILAVVLPAGAQQVPIVQLSRPDAELSEPFDQVTAVRELSDGRLVVADVFARTVSLVDLKADDAKAIGREGQGPREFGFPMGLMPLPGDTTWVVDPAQSRFLVILPDGTPTGTVAFPDRLSGFGRFKGADAMGRLYVQGSGFGADGPGDPRSLPDSAPVLRWDRKADQLTEIGKVKLPAVAVSTAGSAGNRSVMMRQQPFPVSDDWAVTNAGRVAFVRAGRYHTEWSAPAPRTGAAVSYTPVPVTDADKKELEERQKDNRGALRIHQGRRGQSSIGRAPARGAGAAQGGLARDQAALHAQYRHHVAGRRGLG